MRELVSTSCRVMKLPVTLKTWICCRKHRYCTSFLSFSSSLATNCHCVSSYVLTAVLLSVRCWWPALALAPSSGSTSLTWSRQRPPPYDDCWPGKRPEEVRSSVQITLLLPGTNSASDKDAVEQNVGKHTFNIISTDWHFICT